MKKKEYLTCMELHKKLKEKIAGNIFITIENDTLILYINSFRGVRYKYEIRCISYEVIDGELNYEKIIRIIMDDYKEFIMNKFFRR